jgi:oxygen-dependent protoporphyrinogen oxidase
LRFCSDGGLVVRCCCGWVLLFLASFFNSAWQLIKHLPPPKKPKKTKNADRIRLNWKLTSIARDAATGIFTLKYDTPDGARELRARSVAATLPAWALASLLEPAAPAAAKALASFDYPPVAAVTLAYPESAVRDDRKAADGSVPGFGQLHPRTQGVTTLGTIYSSSLFPGRCPKGEILLLNYIGGATNRGVATAPTEELVAQVKGC